MSTHLLINPSHRSIDKALIMRIDALLDRMGESEVHRYLSETVYLERQRFHRSPDQVSEQERSDIEHLARSLTEGVEAMRSAAARLVKAYSHEVHNRFSERTFGAALKLAPAALKRLLGPAETGVWNWTQFDAGDRILIQGPLADLRVLAQTHTLVFAPTHLSNLDSPLVGYALHQAGLPPCSYGAGLNLFANPIMGFVMSRLGAYTVDRRKRHRLYKDVLKAYSVELIGRGAHSLFYPGGSRSRSGTIESSVKRGLLGTAIAAWQEGLADERKSSEVLVVPVTLSCSLVLEAETLIEDALAGEGKSRYIINDDEFSRASTVLNFAKKLSDLDASVVVRFGDPMDVLGNPVDGVGRSLNVDGSAFDRTAYVTDKTGRVVADVQRDRVYTNHLAEAICRAYQRDNVVLPTHLAAFAGWHCLGEKFPGLDRYHRALLAPFEQWVDRGRMVAVIEELMVQLDQKAAEGSIHLQLPEGSDRGERTLSSAVATFGRFHTRAGLAFEDWRVLVDPKLALYYGNRLAGADLKVGEPS